MTKVLITGGAGFIGSNLAKVLNSMGHEVITLDIKNIKKQNHIVADVTDKDVLKKACKGIDYIFHLAAVTSPPEFLDLMSDSYSINVLGTYNVLAAGLSEGVRRVIIASSSSVYGNINTTASEELLPKQYDNFYPLSKLINELTAKAFFKYGLETISLRYFNTYGMEKMKGKYSSVIWKFIDDIMNGRQPVIYGDGTQSRDFIYVDDVVRATILAMDRGAPGEAY
ncbi:MAG: NAD-dependent epimerase/dehydratase family protein, partial [Nitrososphaeria archaeon]